MLVRRTMFDELVKARGMQRWVERHWKWRVPWPYIRASRYYLLVGTTGVYLCSACGELVAEEYQHRQLGNGWCEFMHANGDPF